MKKIPSVFQRNHETDHLIRDEVVPGCEWVIAGEGRATVKVDGTACMIRGGRLFRRLEVREDRVPPPEFEPCEERDPNTGKLPGWVPVGDGPDDRWHREAFARMRPLVNGTYELVGPKVNGNPYDIPHHEFHRHGGATCAIEDLLNGRTFRAIRSYLQRVHIEGIVYWHPDGRMAKVKRRDFGLPWPAKKESV